MRFCVFPTAFGWVAVVGDAMGLKRTTLPCASGEEALKAVTRGFARLLEDETFFGDLPQRIQRYFEGEPVSFTDTLDLSGLTPFRRSIYLACIVVPRGKTISYGALAQRVGHPGAARAVGRAMATNPLPSLVPCHRVVGSNGNLTGFGGGLELKRRMLALEAARPF